MDQRLVVYDFLASLAVFEEWSLKQAVEVKYLFPVPNRSGHRIERYWFVLLEKVLDFGLSSFF